MFELEQSVVTQYICLKQMAMTIIKENCSIGTRNFVIVLIILSPFVKASGFVVSVKSEATPLINRILPDKSYACRNAFNGY